MSLGHYLNDKPFIEYQLKSLAKTGVPVRAPLPGDLQSGAYFSCLGSTQTFGRYCPTPFPEILGGKLGLPALNLGRGGAGPGYFLKNAALLEHVNRGRFAIVQIMSGRSVNTSRFVDPEGLNHFHKIGQPDRSASGPLWRGAFAEGEAPFRALVEEARTTWLAEMVFLLEAIKVPKILLHFAPRPLPETGAIGPSFDEFWGFPHLVTRPMVERLLPLMNHAYAECISNTGLPQTLTPRPNAENTPAAKNREYPSPEMHGECAAVLEKTVKTLHWPEAGWTPKQAAFVNSAEKFIATVNLPWMFPGVTELLKKLKPGTLVLAGTLERIWIQKHVKYALPVADAAALAHALPLFQGNHVVVASLTREAELVSQVRAALAGRRRKVSVKGLFSDLVFDASLRAPNIRLKRTPQVRSRYAIVCTPRSGSTLLSSLLEKTRVLGRPTEHFTRPVHGAMQLGLIRPDEWLTTLDIAAATSNGVTGTKLIADRLLWLEEVAAPETLDAFFKGRLMIRLIRESLSAQAVSAYFAGQQEVYHSTGESRAAKSAEDVPYDFEKIRKFYDRYEAEEELIDRFIARYRRKDSAMRLTYEELEQAPVKFLREIAGRLEVEAAPEWASLDSGLRRLGSKQKQEFVTRFEADLAALRPAGPVRATG